jgi:uncharacterized lipoprotein YddW (UPF0748 family)
VALSRNKIPGTIFTLCLIVLAVSPCTFSHLFSNEPIRPEVRAIWVDAFHDGAKTPEQIDKLVADCLRANINTIIVQVRRRGDAYYNQSFEPRTEDPNLTPGFDALQYLIDLAHSHQLEVHAWLNTLVAWNNEKPPLSPNHIWNLHGPRAVGKDNWISYYRKYDRKNKRWSNQTYASYFLDPGNPAVVDYTTNVYLNVIKNYDIDGIHLDYTRYDGIGTGYNPVSVNRYNACYGTKGLPHPNDPNWMQWRRDQITNLVRKIYIQAIAIKPNLKVSSAVITWGDAPVIDADWKKSQAYSVVGQDWIGWLKEGIIDIAFPMNYFYEWNPQRRLWFNRWIEWEKNHQYGRQIVIGPCAYSQYIENTIEQIRRVQAPSQQGNYAAGVAIFAYGWNNLYSNDDYKHQARAKNLPRQPHIYYPESNDWIFELLSSPGSYRDPVLGININTNPVFPEPAPIPEMPWKTRPTKGYIMGSVVHSGKKTNDHLKITVESTDTNIPKLIRHTYTDGSGWYGFAEIPAGTYQVTVASKNYSGQQVFSVNVLPGQVAEVNFIEGQ